MFAAIAELFGFLDRRTQRQMVFLIVPMAVTSMLEMLSIGLIIPLLHTLLGGDKNTHLARYVVSIMGESSREYLTIILIVAFLLVFLLKNAALAFISHYTIKFVNIKISDYSANLFRNYLNLPYTAYLRINTSTLVRNVYTTVPRAFEVIRYGLSLALELILVIGTLGLLLTIEPLITSLLIGVLLVAGYSFSRLAGRYHMQSGTRQHVLEAEILQYMTQSFGAIKEVKTLNRQDNFVRRILEIGNELAVYKTSSMFMGQMARIYIETVAVILFVVALLSMVILSQSVESAIAKLGLFAMASLRLVPSLNRILQNINDLRRWAPSVSAMSRDCAAEPDVSAALPSPASQGIKFQHDITLEAINYRYGDDLDPALDGVSLTISRGTRLGIVGPSGSGKTTLMDLMLGLLAPTGGRILIDGIDVAPNMSAWRRMVGYVPQSVYINDDTLRRNVAFGIADSEIDDQAILRALDLAGLTSVLVALPEGLDTRLGENGNRLSGGQRQRVGIARALYGDPQVVIFDEATSALDNETEHEVNMVLEDLAGRKTILVIAHRLSSVRTCSSIVFLAAGKVLDIGRFDELYDRLPAFRSMVDMSDVSLDLRGQNRIDISLDGKI
jgi:ATP-binding cassette subfamily C protein